MDNLCTVFSRTPSHHGWQGTQAASRTLNFIQKLQVSIKAHEQMIQLVPGGLTHRGYRWPEGGLVCSVGHGALHTTQARGQARK